MTAPSSYFRHDIRQDEWERKMLRQLVQINDQLLVLRQLLEAQLNKEQ